MTDFMEIDDTKLSPESQPSQNVIDALKRANLQEESVRLAIVNLLTAYDAERAIVQNDMSSALHSAVRELRKIYRDMR